MRNILFALILLATALAGCGDAPAEPSATETSTDTTTQTGTSSNGTSTSQTTGPEPNQTAGPEPNTPPSASLSASIQQGEAPVEVTFTLDGSDADGDNLTWTFDADEDGAFEAEGTELPATVLFEYVTEGVYNATLTVHDGANTTTASVAIDVAAAIEESGPHQVLTVSWAAGSGYYAGAHEGIMCEEGPGAGITHAFLGIDAPAVDLPFVATITDASGGAAVDEWGIWLVDPACDGNGLDTYGGPGDTLTGTVKAGTTTGYVYAYGGAMLEATITIG